MRNFLNPDRLKWFGISRVIGSVLSVAFVGVAGWWLVQVPPPPPEASLSFASSTIAANTSIGVSGSSINTTPQIITVHVAGAVKNPGVYRLKYGSRINDGLVAAGGATSAANLDVINLATVLILFNCNFNWQTMAIPAGFTDYLLTFHGLKSGEQIPFLQSSSFRLG